MREVAEWLFVVILIIATIYLLIDTYNDRSNKASCLDSEYKTTDYDVKLGVLYCRSSDNSYQRLIKPKARSPHLDDHKSEKE